MKRVFLMVAVILGAAFGGRGQSIVQVGEQLALDVEKLSELKGILSDMYSAYAIVEKGYTDIRDIVRGGFDLHKAFLDALLTVSPSLQGYSRVQEILSLEAEIVAEYKAASRQLAASGRFTFAELDYMNRVYSNLLNRSAGWVRELVMLTTAGELRMSDAERLDGIDRVYEVMLEERRKLRMMDAVLAVQAGLRAREAADIGSLRGIYGLTP